MALDDIVGTAVGGAIAIGLLGQAQRSLDASQRRRPRRRTRRRRTKKKSTLDLPDRLKI